MALEAVVSLFLSAVNSGTRAIPEKIDCTVFSLVLGGKAWRARVNNFVTGSQVLGYVGLL